MSVLVREADHDSHLMSIALAARLEGDEGLRPLSPGKYWDAVDEFDGELLAAAESTDANVRSLADRKSLAALHGSELESQGISVLSPFHEHYPATFAQVLGRNAPPLLYVAGDPSSLNDGRRHRLGVVGSRDADSTDLEFASNAAFEATRRSWDVVSGGAKGVDAAALNEASTAGGFIVGVLAEGLRRAMRKGSLRRLVTAGGAVLLSAVHPDAGFSVGAAMGRNKLIYAVSDVTVVVAASEGEGGSWAGASEALRRGYGRVAVVRSAEASTALHQLGAHVIDDVHEIFQVTAGGFDGPRQETDAGAQPSLFD